MFNRVTPPGSLPTGTDGRSQLVQPNPPMNQLAQSTQPPAHRPKTSNGAEEAQAPPTSVIGSDLLITGQHVSIVSKTSLLIAGSIAGDINGEEIIVAQTGAVSGTITARIIRIQGQVSGALRGSIITLASTAQVDGDIVKQTLIIEEGAHFDGNVRRAKDISEITPNLQPRS